MEKIIESPNPFLNSDLERKMQKLISRNDKSDFIESDEKRHEVQLEIERELIKFFPHSLPCINDSDFLFNILRCIRVNTEIREAVKLKIWEIFEKRVEDIVKLICIDNRALIKLMWTLEGCTTLSRVYGDEILVNHGDQVIAKLEDMFARSWKVVDIPMLTLAFGHLGGERPPKSLASLVAIIANKICKLVPQVQLSPTSLDDAYILTQLWHREKFGIEHADNRRFESGIEHFLRQINDLETLTRAEKKLIGPPIGSQVPKNLRSKISKFVVECEQRINKQAS